MRIVAKGLPENFDEKATDNYIRLIDEKGHNVLESLYLNNIFIKIKAGKVPMVVLEAYIDSIDVESDHVVINQISYPARVKETVKK